MINVYCFRLSANVCRSVQKKNHTQSFSNENLKKVNLYRDVSDLRQSAYGSLTVNPSSPEGISASGCGLLVSYMRMGEGAIIIMNET